MKKVWKIFSQSDGYTYIETFITIIILSLITATLFTQYSDIKEFLVKGQLELQSHYEKMQLRVVILEEVQKIRNPWFMKEYNLEEEEGKLKLYYYLGDPELFLEFQYGEGGVTISSKDGYIFQSETSLGSFEFKKGVLYYLDEHYPYQVRTCITL